MLRVSDIRFSPAGPDEQRVGMLGYLRFVLNERLVIDGVTLRRTQDRRLALSFPSREDRRGQRHYVVRPVNDAARLEIERQILGQLGQETTS